MTWHQLFTEYEVIVTSATTIITSIALVIGYFIKRKYDLKSKKIEINHNLFQQDRLKAVQSFFSQVAKTESMWHSFSFYGFLNDKSNDGSLEDMLDEKIWGDFYALKQTILNVQIFFKNEELKYFEEVFENFNKINKIVSYFHFRPKDSYTNNEAAFVYRQTVDEAHKNNKIALNNIAEIMSKSYNK